MTDVDPKRWQIGLVGYGEVGRILAEDLRARASLSAPTTSSSARRPHRRWSSTPARTASGSSPRTRELAARADFIVSAVTASQAVAVAESCAPALEPGAWFLDFNSASPGAKSAPRRLDRRRPAAATSRAR